MTATSALKNISDSGSFGSSNEYVKEGFVFGATDISTAITTCLADTTNYPINVTVSVYGVDFNFVRGTATARQQGDGMDNPETWEMTVKYDLLGYSSQPNQTGDMTTTFELGFDAINVKMALSEVSKYTVDNTNFPVPALGGLINATDDGVMGVDIEVPTFRWSETHYIADGDVTTSYINAVYAVANSPINNATFRGFAAGEVLFKGLQGSRRYNNGDWELTYSFAATPNVTDLLPGSAFDSSPGTGPIVKAGWDYAWFTYTNQVITAGSTKYLKPQPQHCYVDQIYNSSDFSTLGIGTS